MLALAQQSTPPRERWPGGYFYFVGWTASLLLLTMVSVTLLAWRHELSLDKSAINASVGIRRTQLARRFEQAMSAPISPLQVLALDAQHSNDPSVIFDSVTNTSRVFPTCHRLAWLNADGRAVYAIAGETRLVPPDADLTSVPDWQQTWSDACAASIADTDSFPAAVISPAFTIGHDTMIDIVVPAARGSKDTVVIGAVVGRFSLTEIVSQIFDDSTLAQFDIRISDGPGTLLQLPTGVTWNSDPSDAEPLHVHSEPWVLHVRPTRAYVAATSSRAPRWILLGGLCASLLITGLILQARRYHHGKLEQARAYGDALERLQSVSAAISARLGSGDDVLNKLASAAGELIGMSRVAVAVREPTKSGDAEGPTVRFVAAVGWPDGVVGTRFFLSALETVRMAIEEKRTIVIGDTMNTDLPAAMLREHQLRSVIQIPLLIEGRVIGLMSLTDERPRIFTEAELRLAHLWGAQAAVILANEQLHERAQSALKVQEQLMDQREKLSTVTAAIYAEPTLDGAISKIVELTPSVLEVDICLVFLVAENRKDLIVVAATPPCDSMIGEKVPMSYPGFERIFATRQVRLVPNAAVETIRHPTWAMVPQLGSFIGAPMFQGEGQPLGALILIRNAVGDFTRQQIDQAQLFAARASSAIENARLLQQTQEDAQTKAMLLKELNHRVKNNLAGIAGLLAAQQSKMPRTDQPPLARLSRQVRVMARAHELFAGGAAVVGLEELIREVAASVSAGRPPGVEIRTKLDGIHTRLATDRAVSLAMVLNELMYNGFVHGLGDQGVLEIQARRINGSRLSIEISDTGLPGRSTDAPTGLGMGLELVNGLVGRELRGEFHLDPIPTGGTRAVVEFPLTEQEAQETMT
jgi:two-component sensor histidine kinase